MRRLIGLACTFTVLMGGGCGDQPYMQPTTTSGGATSTVPATTAVTSTTVVEPIVAARGPAPWALDPVEDVPGLVVDEWTAAGDRAWCSMLLPAGMDEPAQGAMLRAADFGGGWGLAWDLAAGPGRYGTGEYCADCGRGAFGIGTFQGTGTSGLLPVTDRWDDGTEGRLGSEATRFSGGIPADRVSVTDPQTGEPAVAPYEMFLQPAGFDCPYWVWSFLGPDHVEYLVAHLRRVTGYPD